MHFFLACNVRPDEIIATIQEAKLLTSSLEYTKACVKFENEVPDTFDIVIESLIANGRPKPLSVLLNICLKNLKYNFNDF